FAAIPHGASGPRRRATDDSTVSVVRKSSHADWWGGNAAGGDQMAALRPLRPRGPTPKARRDRAGKIARSTAHAAPGQRSGDPRLRLMPLDSARGRATIGALARG